MTTLANIFIQIDLNFSENEKNYGYKYLKNIIESYGNTIYRQDIRLKLEFKDGSLKIYIIIIGTIYLAIGQYGSFRSGIDYIKKDTKLLHQIIINDLNKNGLEKNQILKSKIDSSTISRISRLINRIEKVQNSNHSKIKLKNEINNILKYTQKILYELENKNDEALFLDTLYEIDNKQIIYNNIPKNKKQLPIGKNIFIRKEEEYYNAIDKQFLLNKYIEKEETKFLDHKNDNKT